MEGLRLDQWLARQLVCPRDGHDLSNESDKMQCRVGHDYPLVDGIPVLLAPDANVTRSCENCRSPRGCERSPSGTPTTRSSRPLKRLRPSRCSACSASVAAST